MKDDETTIAFRTREFKGSRLRCLLLTSDSRAKVAAFLSSLAAPFAFVQPEDLWAPCGFLEPDEAKLGETPGFLTKAEQAILTQWWLAHPGRANTPNWDIVSQCRIEDRRGLILVEAKAHESEFSNDRCGATNQENAQHIKEALADATSAWNAVQPGFSLSADSYYQLSNRFAFAWKLASLGIPVVLIYLGFLNAEEMASGGRRIFHDLDQWRRCVLEGAKATIPSTVWDKSIKINGIPLTLLIRSAIVHIEALAIKDGA